MHLNASPSRSQRASFEVIKLLRRENVFIYRLGGISHKEEEEEEDLRAPKGVEVRYGKGQSVSSEPS